MKPEIKAMLPEFPTLYVSSSLPCYDRNQIEDWLEKLTEGASVVYAPDNETAAWDEEKLSDDTHIALLICPREIDNRVPLSEVLRSLRDDREIDQLIVSERAEKYGVDVTK